MILSSAQKGNLIKKLKKLGFYEPECKKILSRFKERRIEESISYFVWLKANKPDREYEKTYFYYLLHNFDETKLYPAYSDYLSVKKNVSKLPQKDTTKHVIGDTKVGKDAKTVNNKPKNILEFIKYGTSKKKRQ